MMLLLVMLVLVVWRPSKPNRRSAVTVAAERISSVNPRYYRPGLPHIGLLKHLL